jgi:RNA polymerase sigma factor (sigma-70 family)
VEGQPDLASALAAHQGRVYTYFRRMGVASEAARDMSQETFVRAIAGSRRYRGDAPFVVWLLGIARNVFREWARRHREEPVADPGSEQGPDPTPSAEAMDVGRTLARLDRDHREVLVLRFVLDLSGEEVARVLGVSHEAVRQRVARAKAEFRSLWSK